MSIKETIRAEIERRIDTCYRTDGRIAPPRTRNAIVIDEFQDLLAFLDTLPEQPVNKLEEEIDRLWESFSEEMSGPHNLFDIYRRLARHFAEWGAEHAKK